MGGWTTSELLLMHFSFYYSFCLHLFIQFLISSLYIASMIHNPTVLKIISVLVFDIFLIAICCIDLPIMLYTLFQVTVFPLVWRILSRYFLLTPITLFMRFHIVTRLVRIFFCLFSCSNTRHIEQLHKNSQEHKILLESKNFSYRHIEKSIRYRREKIEWKTWVYV